MANLLTDYQLKLFLQQYPEYEGTAALHGFRYNPALSPEIAPVWLEDKFAFIFKLLFSYG